MSARQNLPWPLGPRGSKSLAGGAGPKNPSFEGAERLKNASQI